MRNQNFKTGPCSGFVSSSFNTSQTKQEEWTPPPPVQSSTCKRAYDYRHHRKCSKKPISTALGPNSFPDIGNKNVTTPYGNDTQNIARHRLTMVLFSI
jgi:hypothetical protein